MVGADPVWLVSPHLLVAQAMAVALASVGTPAVAHTWQSTIGERATVDAGRAPGRIVVVLDGFDDPALLDQVAHAVQTTDVRVVLITSSPVATSCGGLLQDDRVDLATDVTSVARLAEVVEDFLAGRALMEPEDRESVHAAWLRELEHRRHVEALLATLSPQQAKVLELLASGRRVAEVGALLGVTHGTARSHVKALRAKLGARSQLEAVAMLRMVHDATGAGGAARAAGDVDTMGDVVALPRPRRARDGSGAETRR